jgi:hypothetical protein
MGSKGESRVEVLMKLMEKAVWPSDKLAAVSVLLENKLSKALMEASEVRLGLAIWYIIVLEN